MSSPRHHSDSWSQRGLSPFSSPPRSSWSSAYGYRRPREPLFEAQTSNFRLHGSPEWNARNGQTRGAQLYNGGSQSSGYNPYDARAAFSVSQHEDVKCENILLKAQIEELKQKLAVSEGKLQFSREAYSELISKVESLGAYRDAGPTTSVSLPSAVTGSTDLESLARLETMIPKRTLEDCQNAKFYYKVTYLEHSKTRARETLTKTSDSPEADEWTAKCAYITDLAGDAVARHRISDMRAHARCIFRGFLNSGIAPPTWGAADIRMKKTYEAEICSKFPELSYCENNWKAHALATDIYPGWYRKLKIRQGPTRMNPEQAALSSSDAVIEEAENSGTKRSGEGLNGLRQNSSKRARRCENQPSSPDETPMPTITNPSLPPALSRASRPSRLSSPPEAVSSTEVQEVQAPQTVVNRGQRNLRKATVGRGVNGKLRSARCRS